MSLKKLLEENPEITVVFSPSELSEPVQFIKTFPSRQELRKQERLTEKENKKTMARARRFAIIDMNKKQAYLRRIYNNIIEKEKEDSKQHRNEHRAGYKKPSATMDDSSSISAAISQSGY